MKKIMIDWKLAVKVAVVAAACVALQGSAESRALTPERLETLKHSLIHRGDGKGRPDNTMEALLYTWAKGYTPESDIRFTKDGKIVAFHDNTLNKRKISEWLWAELREQDVGSYRGAQYATCRAPLWETIFTAMEENPSRKIHIDWKDVPPEKVAEMEPGAIWNDRVAERLCEILPVADRAGLRVAYAACCDKYVLCPESKVLRRDKKAVLERLDRRDCAVR